MKKLAWQGEYAIVILPLDIESNAYLFAVPPVGKSEPVRPVALKGKHRGQLNSAMAGRKSGRNAHAVIIGINHYSDPAIKNLAYAKADAQAIYDVLTDPDIGSFPPEQVTLLINEEATQRSIRSSIGTQLRRRAGEEDIVLVFFAGHGAPEIDPGDGSADGMQKYLIPYDAEMDDLFSSAISMEEVQEYFGRLASRQIVFLIDCCYSGMAGGRTFANSKYSTRGRFTTQFLDTIGGAGRVVITACDVNEVSLESPELKHGVFTHYLVSGLRGEADADGNGLVSLDELYTYVYSKVARHARSMGGKMHPIRKGTARGTLNLAKAGESNHDWFAESKALLQIGNEASEKALSSWNKKFGLFNPGIKWGGVGLLVLMAAWFVINPPGIFQGAAPSGGVPATSAAAVPAEKQRLAILPIQRLGDERTDPGRDVGLLIFLSDALSDIKGIKSTYSVVATGEILAQNITSARDADSLLQADLVISSFFQQTEDQLYMTMELINAQTMVNVASQSIQVSANELDRVHPELVKQLAELLSVDLDEDTESRLIAASNLAPGAFDYYLQGLGYLGRWDEETSLDIALSQFEESIALDSQNPLAYAGLARTYIRKYQQSYEPELVDKALDNAQKALQLDSTSTLTPVFVTVGMLHLANGEFAEAVEEFQTVVALDPENDYAYLLLGRAYEHASQFDMAEERIKKAIALNPSNWSNYNVLGDLYFLRGRFEESIEQHQIVVKLAPDNYWGPNNLALSYQWAGNSEEAEAAFLEAIEVSGTDSREASLPYTGLAGLRYAERRYEEALVLLETAVERNASNIRAWSYMANVAYLSDQKEKADEVWTRQVIPMGESRLEVDPYDEFALKFTADAYAKTGQTDEALALLERLAEYPRKYPDANVMLIHLYYYLGKHEQALYFLEEGFKKGITVMNIEQYPWLDPFREDPMYKDKLIQASG